MQEEFKKHVLFLAIFSPPKNLYLISNITGFRRILHKLAVCTTLKAFKERSYVQNIQFQYNFSLLLIGQEQILKIFYIGGKKKTILGNERKKKVLKESMCSYANSCTKPEPHSPFEYCTSLEKKKHESSVEICNKQISKQIVS